MRQALLLVGGIALMGACASTNDGPRPGGSAASQSLAAGVIDTEAADPGALDVASLPAGSCGMLLWMVERGQPVMIFRGIQNEPAQMVLDGTEAQLIQISRRGERRGGFYSEQSYADSVSGVQVSIDVSFGNNFRGVVTVDDGILTLTNSEGWEKVIPVAGFAGCRAA